MPRKATKRAEDEETVEAIDVQYNPDIINGLLNELAIHVDQKCQQIQADTDFMASSIRQAFNLELIKLPTQVKQMSISRFREEFGDSMEAVTMKAMGGGVKKPISAAAPSTATKATRGAAATAAAPKVFQTPSHNRRGSAVLDTASKSMRAPREGERIVSANGSPLGEFNTVVKAPKPNNSSIAVPPTPGVFVPLQTGEVLDLGNVDVERLPETVKEDALEKMQMMMKNMQSLMSKLQK